MKAYSILLFATIALFAAAPIQPATAETPLQAHPQNPYIFEFRGQPTVLRTYAEQYGSVINTGFDFNSYLDVLQRDRMNLTRVMLVGYRNLPKSGSNTAPLAPSPAQFLQPWPRGSSPAKALDGLDKWDFTVWDERYFSRLKDFVQACSDRGIVTELTLFSTLYEDAVWRASPFNPANNIQGYGPSRFPDALRPINANLLATQEAAVRRIVREVNRFDNIYYEVQNEPFWNEPGPKEYLDVEFQNIMIAAILDEESRLPNKHLIAHNYPQKASVLSGGFKVINEHYPALVPNTNIAGAEVLLRDHYSRGLILGLGETNTSNAVQTRLESWMFLLGGGGIYNGLDGVQAVYSVQDPGGDSPLGGEIRGAVRNGGNYVQNLDLVSLRRDLSWITGGIPTGATLQAMAHRGQQYAAYLHHGKSGLKQYQTVYDPIDSATHTVSLIAALEQGSWRAVWTRPSDLAILRTEDFTHQGGSYHLAPVSYQEDVALRIDRTGSGDTTGTNTAPVAVADSYSVNQNTALTISVEGVLTNDADAESNPLTAVLDVGPSHGNITLVANGGFTYTPAASFVGVDTFTYHANDGALNSNIVTVVINVNSIVLAALINGSFEQEFTGWTKTGNLEVRAGSIYTATDGARMAVFNAAQKTPDGTLSQSFGTVIGQTYTLQFDAGVVSYNTYAQTLGVTVTGAGSLLSKAVTINGLGGGSNRWLPQTFTFIANSPTTTLSFQDRSSLTDSLDLLLDNVRVTGTVVGPNTAPVASADFYSAGQNTTLVISAAGVLTNDTDAQSNYLTAILDSGPGHGSVSLNANGGFTYTPATGYTGVDSFTYHANDGSLNSNSSTVTIDVVALIPGVSFPTIVGKPFIARFRVVPKDATTTVPVLRLKITGNVQLKEVELDSALPTGESSVPYYILFTADSGITTLRFITPGGDSVETGQIAGLEVTEPLTLAPSSLPNPRQQAQIDRRYGLFLHYGINTFHDLEWSDGTKPASSYNPTALDVEQWVKTACEAGMRYVLIISKHHDGFCLWDSPWTTYDVGSSPVKTNVIAAAAAACKKYGIAMGLYYSVWDRHEPSYGNDAAYNQFLLRQLQELLGNNGPVCELWLDGAWDKANTRWPSTEVYDLVRRLQPDCQVSFNGTIGNPTSPDTNAVPNNQQEGFPIRYFPSDFRLSDPLFAKTPDPKIFSHDGNSYFLAFEATTMLSGYSKWFYNTYDNYNRSVSDLAAIYESATAQNNILVLNAPPDRRGLVRDLERSTLFQLRDRVGLKSGLSLPYGSNPLTIPGKIQVEDFDTGGQGVAYNDLTTTNSGGQYRTAEGVDIATATDVDGGHQVLGTRAGEWLKYTLNVATAGNYLVNIRTANETAGGQIYLEVDGINISGMISIPNTGSMDTWQTLALPNVTLGAGGHILRLVIAANDPSGIAGAFNWISFSAEPRPGPTAAAGQDFEVLDTDNNGFGDGALDASASIAGNSPITNFEWKEGGSLLASGIRPTLNLSIGSHLIELMVTDGHSLSDSDEVLVTVSARGLVNGSFEYGYHGWTATGNQGIEALAPYVASDGNQLVAFNSHDLTSNGTISQVIETIAGQAYLLKFDAGVLAYNTNSQTMRVTLDGTSSLLSKTITISGLSGVNNRWVPQSFRFVADSNSTTLAFRDESTSYTGIDLLLDNVWVSRDTTHPTIIPSNLQIMPLGDSITYGSAGSDGGYRGPLYKIFNPLGLNIRFVGSSIEGPGSLPSQPVDQRHHEGHSSYTIQDTSNNLDGVDNATFLQYGGADRDPNGGYWLTGGNGTGREPLYPDVITLMIGTNDISNLTGVGSRLQSLITKIITQRPAAKIFVAKITPWPARQAAVASYNAIVTSVVEVARASGGNVYLVDLNSAFPADGLHTDGVHPNDVGYRWIASQWYLAMEAAYSAVPGGMVNGSFEADEVGWTMSGNRNVVTSDDSLVAFHGIKSLVLNADHTTPNAVVSQTFSTIPGKTYQLSLMVGVRASNSDEQKLGVGIAGAVPLIPPTVESILGTGLNRTVWESRTYQFIADQAGTTVTFTDLSLSTFGIDLLLDNVKVTESVNTKPVAVADAYSVSQDATLVVPDSGVLVNDYDSESDSLTAVLRTSPGHGNLVLNARGGFTYTPTAGFTGADLFTYLATDGGLISNVATVSLAVNPPTPVGLVNGSFEYGFQGWVTSGNQGIYSTAPYAPTNGTNLVAFNAAQATPNAVLSQTFATTVGQTLRLDFDVGVLAYNFNSQKLQVVVKGTGEILSKTITVNGAGGGISRWFPQNLIFTANSASTTLTFRDQSASSDALDLLLDNLRITAGTETPNTSPVAVADSYSTDQNTALVVPDTGVLANDTDAESTSLTATSVTSPAHGSLNLNPKGGFTYTPAAGYTGTDSFTYQASDSTLNSNIVSVNITIKAVVSVFFANGSFESGFSGWMTSGNIDIRSSAPYVPTNGAQLVAFNSGNRTPNATLSQTFSTIVGQNYTLTFDAGVVAYNTNSQLMQVTVAGTGSLLSRTIAISGLGGGANRWLPQSFTFVADSGSTKLTFGDISTSTIGLDLLLDNVRVTGLPANTAAPLASREPASGKSSDRLAQALTLPSGGLGTPFLSGAPGDLTIRMTAPVDGSYFLECSEDLKTWEFVTEGVFKASEPIEFHDTRVMSDKSPAKTRMFYRIGFTP
jgi:alpha-L-fucosidase